MSTGEHSRQEMDRVLGFEGLSPEERARHAENLLTVTDEAEDIGRQIAERSHGRLTAEEGSRAVLAMRRRVGWDVSDAERDRVLAEEVTRIFAAKQSQDDDAKGASR